MDDLIFRSAAIEEIQNAYCDTEGGEDKYAVWKNVGLTEALHIMQDLPPAQRWIPVTERLPENFEPVLCWYEYYHWSKGKILPEYGIGYVINGRWGGEVTSGKDCKVLAWMPLPGPPKEEP